MHLFTYVSSGLNRENVRLSVGMCLGPDHKPNTLPKPSQSALHVNNFTLLFLTCYVQLSGFQQCPGGGGGGVTRSDGDDQMESKVKTQKNP